jgi:hypothetical protein
MYVILTSLVSHHYGMLYVLYIHSIPSIKCISSIGNVTNRQTLESRFFTHLPGSYTPTILMLEKSLQRAFLVKAIKTGHMDKVTEFFARYSHELTKPGSDWEPWFGIVTFIHFRSLS